MSASDTQSGHAGGSQTSSDGKVIVPIDESGTWWADNVKNPVNAQFGRFSRADEDRYLRQLEAQRWPELLKNCQDRRSELMKYSPVIRFMREKIGQMGGRVTNQSFPCNFCDVMSSGTFNPTIGMQLCANKIYSKNQQEDTMAHELIHAYDHLRFDVDYNNLRHMACLEVRASSLSGECRFTTEFWKHGQYKLNKGYQDCVKRRATLSLSVKKDCRDRDHAAQIVDSVFDSCMTDTRPFDEVYR